MPVPTLITDLSTVAGSNFPAGTDSPSILDDVQRAHASFIAQLRDGTAGVGVNKADLANTTDPTKGAGMVRWFLSITGFVARWVSEKLAERVSVLDFGADPTGVADSTAAFTDAKVYLSGLGGGIAYMPLGVYKLTNFDLDYQNIMFVGETSGWGYSSITASVQIIPGATATYAARLKGTRSGVVINAAAGSGFRNVQFLGTGGAIDYGLFIDSGATINEDVTIQGFKYGCVIADQANSNQFQRFSCILNTLVGFAVTEWQGAAYLHPGVTGITSVSNTNFNMNSCNFRENGFGMVLRSTVGPSFKNCVWESNDQAGIYAYRTDNSSLRELTFENCWNENNYSAYTSGSTSYSIAGNRMFLIGGASTYIVWTSLNQAGYQLVIDSQTRAGGGGDTIDFNTCQFSQDTAAQKAILILSGFKITFRKPWINGGDTPNLVLVASDAEAVHWHDPLAGNDPKALVTSLTDSFGANSGARGAYFKSGTSFNAAELGGTYPALGVFGGPVHFLSPVANDPRTLNARVLDDYFEGDNSYTIPWRTGSALPFTVNTQTTSVTKVGRRVHVEMVATLTANATTAGADQLYTGINLPYAAAVSGNLVGQAWVQATGGGATVLNNGICPMWLESTAGLIGAINVFPALAIGNTFTIKVSADYISAT